MLDPLAGVIVFGIVAVAALTTATCLLIWRQAFARWSDRVFRSGVFTGETRAIIAVVLEYLVGAMALYGFLFHLMRLIG